MTQAIPCLNLRTLVSALAVLTLGSASTALAAPQRSKPFDVVLKASYESRVYSLRYKCENKDALGEYKRQSIPETAPSLVTYLLVAGANKACADGPGERPHPMAPPRTGDKPVAEVAVTDDERPAKTPDTAPQAAAAPAAETKAPETKPSPKTPRVVLVREPVTEETAEAPALAAPAPQPAAPPAKLSASSALAIEAENAGKEKKEWREPFKVAYKTRVAGKVYRFEYQCANSWSAGKFIPDERKTADDFVAALPLDMAQRSLAPKACAKGPHPTSGDYNLAGAEVKEGETIAKYEPIPAEEIARREERRLAERMRLAEERKAQEAARQTQDQAAAARSRALIAGAQLTARLEAERAAQSRGEAPAVAATEAQPPTRVMRVGSVPLADESYREQRYLAAKERRAREAAASRKPTGSKPAVATWNSGPSVSKPAVRRLAERRAAATWGGASATSAAAERDGARRPLAARPGTPLPKRKPAAPKPPEAPSPGNALDELVASGDGRHAAPARTASSAAKTSSSVETTPSETAATAPAPAPAPQPQTEAETGEAALRATIERAIQKVNSGQAQATSEDDDEAAARRARAHRERQKLVSSDRAHDRAESPRLAVAFIRDLETAGNTRPKIYEARYRCEDGAQSKGALLNASEIPAVARKRAQARAENVCLVIDGDCGALGRQFGYDQARERLAGDSVTCDNLPYGAWSSELLAHERAATQGCHEGTRGREFRRSYLRGENDAIMAYAGEHACEFEQVNTARDGKVSFQEGDFPLSVMRVDDDAFATPAR